MHRFCLVLVLIAGCKKSREDSCDDLAKLGVAFADELGKQLGSGKGKSLGADPEIKAKLAEFKQQCMQWPEEVFECMRKGDETSPKCKEAMTHVTGRVATDVAKAPAGPPVVARAKLGEVRWDGMPVSLVADGTLIAGPKDAIVAVDATGKERWQVAISHGNWLLVDNGIVLVGDHETQDLVALDVATGAPKWRVTVPKHADEGISDRTTEGAVRVGDRVLVPTADGRFLRVDPAACAKPKQKGCIEQAFALAGETIDDPQLLAIGDDILIGESNAIRRLSPTGKVLAWIHVRDSFGGFAVGSDQRLAAVMDDELVLFDLPRCDQSEAIALPRKQGRMYMRGEGECESYSCTAAPDGCLVARSELSDVDSHAPTILRDGSVMVSNYDGPARAAINGNKHWASEVDSIGPIREIGDTVVFVSRGDDLEPARVIALDTATGKAKWTSKLDGIVSTVSSTTDVTIATAGPWLVAGAKGDVAWIKLP